jgi:hypothetical protein
MKKKFRKIINPTRLTGIGIHQDSLRVPMYDPVVTSDLHWREIELSGMASPSQSVKKSLKFLLFGVSATALTLSLFHFYSDRDVDSSVEFIVNEKHHQNFHDSKLYLLSLLFGSYFLFNSKLCRKFSFPILKRILTTKNQVLFSPLNWIVETNIYRLLITAILIYWNTKPEQFKHNIENYFLSGALGGIFGTVFAGIVLARAASPLAHSGFLSVIAGLIGFINFKPLHRYYDTDRAFYTSSQKLQSSNRDYLMSTPTNALPYLMLALAYFGFIAGFFVPGPVPIWLAAIAGGFTGGHCARQIDQNRIYFRQQADALIQNAQNINFSQII